MNEAMKTEQQNNIVGGWRMLLSRLLAVMVVGIDCKMMLVLRHELGGAAY